MSPAISTRLPFENLGTIIAGQPCDLFGEATILGDRRTWWIEAISIDLEGGPPLRLKPRTELFETTRVALHRQCGDAIADRLNSYVEERGGYAILFGEALPTDRFGRGQDRFDAPDRVWLDAA